MARLALLVTALVLAVPAASAVAAPRPIPLSSCVERVNGVPRIAVFQARLSGSRAVRVRLGGQNRVSGGRVIGAHRQIFRPGSHLALRVRFNKGARAVRWHLGRRIAVAGGRTRSCSGGAPRRPENVTAPAPAPPAPAPGNAPAPITKLSVEADPGLQPSFATGTPDYVTRCKGTTPVTVTVDAPADSPVSVDGQAAQTGHFQAAVSLATGQRFDFKVGDTAYHVRCMPGDFPKFTSAVDGTPQAEFFLVAPSLFAPAGNYAAIFDAHGAPVWWMKGESAPTDFKLLSDGNVGFFSKYQAVAQQFNEFKLDGTFVRGTNTIGTPTDGHDYVELPNGNRYLMSYRFRDHVDVSAETGKPEDADAGVTDAEVQEIDPNGSVVWTWNAKDHLTFSETGHWFQDYPAGKTNDGRNVYDINHINAIEPDGDGIVVSMRHTDALYRIDKTTGNITWKLGGTPRAESLTMVGDPVGNFGGQHDVRLLPDGTLTVHDNGVGRLGYPRALRFQLNLNARTATEIESVRDPEVPSAICCGSARRLPGGDWVMSWGANSLVTELTPDGKRPYRIDFEKPVGSYRADPILPGQLAVADIRAGMDAQYPRP